AHTRAGSPEPAGGGAGPARPASRGALLLPLLRARGLRRRAHPRPRHVALMSWKPRPQVPFDFKRPSVHFVNDDVHLSLAGDTMQVWIGADDPMQGRLLLVADTRGLRVEWQKGCTQADFHSIVDKLRSLGIPRPIIGQALRQLHRQLHTAQ